ncbi:RtcB family protein [Candidatus Poribacteria bacterium]|nr:RtcB family protein [Candidatus Poribacteria bacterium]
MPELVKINNFMWEVPRTGDMHVPGLIFTDENFVNHLYDENAIEQIKNVAHLPGIVSRSMAMPDVHSGYGFPIGGVAATQLDTGVVSPSGVGYDINCGVRAMKTALNYNEIKTHVHDLINVLFNNIPCGVGEEGKLRISKKEINNESFSCYN